MNLADLPVNSAWIIDDWIESWSGGDYIGTTEVGIGGKALDDMTAAQIMRVIHFHAVSIEGYGDCEFFAIAELLDGSFAVSEAWTDTTGWGCQANAWWKVGPTYESALAELSEENRRRIADRALSGAS